jgi:hypothetical protein
LVSIRGTEIPMQINNNPLSTTSTTQEETTEEGVPHHIPGEEVKTTIMANNITKLCNSTPIQRRVELGLYHKSFNTRRTPGGSSIWRQQQVLSRRALHASPHSSVTEETHLPVEKAQRNFRCRNRLDYVRRRITFSKSPEEEDFSKQRSSGNSTKFHFSRNRENGSMWSSRPSRRRTSNMLTDTCGPEEEWQVPISNRHAIPELASGGAEIQDVRSRNAIQNVRTRRRNVYSRSSRWLLPHKHAQNSDPVPRVSVGRSLLRLQSAPLRIGNIAISILEDNENSSISSETARTSNSTIL